jgi:hypothetical protein
MRCKSQDTKNTADRFLGHEEESLYACKKLVSYIARTLVPPDGIHRPSDVVPGFAALTGTPHDRDLLGLARVEEVVS